MALNVWQASIVDEDGDVQPGASIEVREQSGLTLASIFTDSAGSTPLANPFTADGDGFARFYVEAGRYRIVATFGANSRTWQDVVLGVPFGEIELPALSIVANSTNATAVATALQAANDGEVLQRSSSVLVFAALGPSSLGSGSACSVLGRSANSSGVRADIAASANDRVLARTSDALSFVQLTAGMFPSSLSLATVLTLTASGAGASTSALSLSAAAPFLNIVETDQSADAQRWLLGISAGVLHLGPVADAATGPATAQGIHITRSGTSATEVQLDATALDFNGDADISGTLTVNGVLTGPAGATFTADAVDEFTVKRTSTQYLSFYGTSGANFITSIGSTTATKNLIIQATTNAAGDAGTAEPSVLLRARAGTNVASFDATEIQFDATLLDFNGAANISGVTQIESTTTSTTAPALRVGGSDTTTFSSIISGVRAGSANLVMRNTSDSVEGAFNASTTSVQIGSVTTHPLVLFASNSTRLTLGASTSDPATFVQYGVFPAATTSIPSIRMPHGTAPSSPTNGDVWTTSSGLFVRLNGTTHTVATLEASNTFTGTTQILQSSNPTLQLWNSSAAAGLMRWSVRAETDGDLAVFTVSDAGSAVENAVVISRNSSSEVTNIALTADAVTIQGVSVADYARLSQSNTFTNGTNKFAATTPRLQFDATGATTNQRLTDIIQTTTAFFVRSRTDADGAGSALIAGTRSGTTWTEFQANATTFDFNGIMSVSGDVLAGDGSVTIYGASQSSFPASNASPHLYRATTGHATIGGLAIPGSLVLSPRSGTANSSGVLFKAGLSGSDEAIVAGIGLGVAVFSPSTEFEINTTTLDINAAADISGSLTLGGNLITASTLTIAGTGETLATFADDGAVTLYYDNAVKLATASGGVAVTGTLTASTGLVATTGGLTVSAGGVNITGNCVTPYTSASEVGRAGKPSRDISASTNTAASDMGGTVRFTGGSGQTFTLDSDPPEDAVVILHNVSGNSWTIAASGTLTVLSDSTINTGSRTLLNAGLMYCVHEGSGNWTCIGGGISFGA